MASVSTRPLPLIQDVDVSFEPVRAATREAAEDGHLVYAQQLVALLVPADTGWFLQLGLGPCEQEGLIFSHLLEAETWVRTCLSGTPWANTFPSA
jgi:hypothetical protein